MQNGDRRPTRSARIRRRDRHGRGLRGVLAPPGVPLHRTRAQRFDDLVLEAVARLEPRWESQLSGIEFAIEEIPPSPGDATPGPVPLGRLDPGSPPPGRARPAITGDERGQPGPATSVPPRIVVYRRPLMARAESEEDLGDLVFDVVVEEFARLLGIDPEEVDPDYGEEE